MGNFVLDICKSKQDIGKKGNNLKILTELFKNDKDIFVPDTIALTKSFYKKVLKNSNGNLDNYENFKITHDDTENIISTIRNRFGDSKLVVRSSATCEDSIFFSASGQYDSFLNIYEDDKIIVSIKKVYSSFYSNNSKLYSSIYNINLNKESMVVLIQPVAPVIKSGVMFSCNPVNKAEKYIIEYTHGFGTNVVEGNNNIKCLEFDYKDKIPDDSLTKRLIDILNRIKKRFNFEVDVEWGVDKLNNIYIFQTRPIIFRDNIIDINYDNIDTIDCISISRGICIGNVDDLSENVNNSILLKNNKYNFNNLELLLSNKGIIVNEKNKLSHFSNILRELAKPCICIDNFNFKKNNLYVIDSFNNKIVDFNNLSNKNKIDFMFHNFRYMMNNPYSFYKYMGIIDIISDDKYEQVAFDIDEKNVIRLLKENGFKKKIINQSIYTYDFKDKFMIDENTLFRIQVSNKDNILQLKRLDLSNKDYRKEETVLLYFDSFEKAKKYVESYNVINTGFQERKIVRYVLDDITINITKWPGCKPYLGIEVSNFKDLNKIKKMLCLDKAYICGIGGKEIFERLSLSLTDCEFKR